MPASDSVFNNVVYITDVIGGVTYQGSGVLISPDEVLTASHVVYLQGVGTASNIRVSPGYNSGSAPQGYFTGVYYHYFPVNDAGGVISLASSQSDYAIIHLSTPTPYQGINVRAVSGGGTVIASGYPSSAAGSRVDLTETVTQDPNYTLLDGSDTGRGSSGGPILSFDTVNGVSVPSVVGLVSSGSGTIGYNTEITASVLTQIKAWVQQDDYSSPLVDRSYYDSNNPDVARSALSPAYHYDVSGWHEGRNPDAYFSTSAYLGVNGDVAAAGMNPVTHYELSGWKEGRDPSALFSTRLYLLHNPDVAQAGIDPLQHYLEDGAAEGRETYASIGPANTLIKDFDPQYYLLANPDVAAAKVDPLMHFMTMGWKEGRNPDAFFSTSGYLQANPDVAAAGINPLLHYEDFGWQEGRNPSADFNTKAYLSANPDVAAARIDPLWHYLSNGAFELRLPMG